MAQKKRVEAPDRASVVGILSFLSLLLVVSVANALGFTSDTMRGWPGLAVVVTTGGLTWLLFRLTYGGGRR